MSYAINIQTSLIDDTFNPGYIPTDITSDTGFIDENQQNLDLLDSDTKIRGSEELDILNFGSNKYYNINRRVYKYIRDLDLYPINIFRIKDTTSIENEAWKLYVRYFQEASTALTEDMPIVENLSEGANDIFQKAQSVVFEEMTEHELQEYILLLIRQYQENAITEIQHKIYNESFYPEVISVVLQSIGDIDNKPTYESRRRFLEEILIQDISPIIRDGANLGLSYMDDPNSLSAFKYAIKNCNNKLLKKMLNKTISQLENTKNASSVTHH